MRMQRILDRRLPQLHDRSPVMLRRQAVDVMHSGFLEKDRQNARALDGPESCHHHLAQALRDPAHRAFRKQRDDDIGDRHELSGVARM